MKIKKYLIPVVAFFMIISCNSTRKSIAIEEGWELLGEKKVNFVKDVDVIEVHSSNKFTAIRFKIEKREVRLNDLKIYYQNGDKLQPLIDDVVPADQNSRDILLASDGRFITKIEFKYRTIGNIFKGRANLLVFGKRYSAGY